MDLLKTLLHILSFLYLTSLCKVIETGRSFNSSIMAADVKEYPSSYQFTIDIPAGIKSGDVKVEGEDGGVLVVSGERKREEVEREEGVVKYLTKERRVGKLVRKFVLGENANLDAINAVCVDGVLSVTVKKLPPPDPHKPKTIEVEAA